MRFKNFAKQEKPWLIALAILVLFSLFFGWKLFWFLTDDAFIAFRYISNSQLGYGYVWNAPPFQPVEGYTSFLWVLLLDIVWRISGIQPPESANWISLLFSYSSLWLGGMMILRMKLAPQLQRHRLLILGLVLLGTISNRTFLAWSSSGLETAVFNFFFTLWIYTALFLPFGTQQWLVGISGSATLIYLTRPDGLLIVAATMMLVILAFIYQKRRGIVNYRAVTALTPILIVPAHLLWRHAFYGEWLPNTYYAKSATDRILVDSGFKYLLSFIFEYALWIWLIILGIFLVYIIRQWQPRSLKKIISGTWHDRMAMLSPIVVTATVIIHLAYYTILVGGDHFEFRVYSYLILLIFISFIWMLNYMRLNLKSVLFLLIFFIALSWPIPWTHWAASQAFTTREETHFLKVSVADALQERFPILPSPLIDYLQYYDRLQFSLIDKLTAVRHQEHKIFFTDLTETLPPRSEVKSSISLDYPVMVVGSTGLVAWVYPHINIIDSYGLNDYVIARNPILRTGGLMAHERRPPQGYLSCFFNDAAQQPIVYVPAEKIIRCEQIFKAWTQSPQLAPALIRADAPPAHLLNVQFGDFFLLQGYDLSIQDETMAITLHWESLEQADFDYSVFVHLVDESGVLLHQQDHSPGSAQEYGPAKWQSGEQIVDNYALPYPASPDKTTLNIGMYNWQTGERLLIHPAEQYPNRFITIHDLTTIK